MRSKRQLIEAYEGAAKLGNPIQISGEEVQAVYMRRVEITTGLRVGIFGGLKRMLAGESFFINGFRAVEKNAVFGGIVEKEVDGRFVVDTGHIVAFDDTLDFSVRRVGGLKATLLSGEGLVAEFRGSGRIWIQTRSVAGYVGWLASPASVEGLVDAYPG